MLNKFIVCVINAITMPANFHAAYIEEGCVASFSASMSITQVLNLFEI